MARTLRRRAIPAAGSVRENLSRPVAPAPVAEGLSRPAPTEAGHRNRSPLHFLKRITPRFLADIIAELSKVTWPTFQETRYLTIVVAIFALALGAILGVVDLAFGWVIDRIFF